MQTDDYGKVGRYTLRYAVYYLNYPGQRVHKEFEVLIEAYCTPTPLTVSTQFTPVTLNYIVGASTPEISTFDYSWTTIPQICNFEIR